jgi:hypothetical protein
MTVMVYLVFVRHDGTIGTRLATTETLQDFAVNWRTQSPGGHAVIPAHDERQAAETFVQAGYLDTIVNCVNKQAERAVGVDLRTFNQGATCEKYRYCA